MKRVFEISRQENISTREAAARLAEERLAAGRSNGRAHAAPRAERQARRRGATGS